MKKLFFAFLLLWIFFVNCLAVKAEIYHGGTLYPPKKITITRDRVISPEGSWTWYNSWVVVRNRDNCYFDEKLAEETIWLEYSYMTWEGKLGDCNHRKIKKIEKWIWENLGYAAIVLYIEEKAENLYVVIYKRNRQKMIFPENRGYPPFDFSLMGDRVSVPVKDIFLLNQAYVYEPSELTEVFIPYSFFAHNFIYEHPKVINRGEAPMVIELKNNGIVVKFRGHNYYKPRRY